MHSFPLVQRRKAPLIRYVLARGRRGIVLWLLAAGAWHLSLAVAQAAHPWPRAEGPAAWDAGSGETATGPRRDLPPAGTQAPPPAGTEQPLSVAALEGQGVGPNRSIFQRFAAGRDASKTWQTLFEVPAGLYPQIDPEAHVVANEGLNWVTSYQPLNRVYFGRSIGYARMVWRPGGQLDTTEVVQWDWTEIIDIAVQPWWIVSLGLGVGFMDGLIFYKDGSFKHRLELFLPVQVGTGFRIGKTWFVDAKLAQSSYFGPGPVASVARALIGLGYNY